MYGDPWTRGAAPHTATKLITAPVIEPYTLEEAKSHCRIVITDDDARVAEWIRAARTKVEKDTGRALLTQTWDLFLDAFYCGGPYLGDFGWPRYARPAIEVPYPPLQSVTSVNQTDTNNNETVWAASNYVVDTASAPGRIGLSDTGSWPTGCEPFSLAACGSSPAGRARKRSPTACGRRWRCKSDGSPRIANRMRSSVTHTNS
jgi:uncharacterized phiE125 gp8 family phage protein